MSSPLSGSAILRRQLPSNSTTTVVLHQRYASQAPHPIGVRQSLAGSLQLEISSPHWLLHCSQNQSWFKLSCSSSIIIAPIPTPQPHGQFLGFGMVCWRYSLNRFSLRELDHDCLDHGSAHVAPATIDPQDQGRVRLAIVPMESRLFIPPSRWVTC